MRLNLRYTFYYPFALVLFTSSVLRGQNLVPNPGFENYSSCPTDDDQMDLAPPWISASTLSPDFFHTCIGSACDDPFPPPVCIPDNWTGSQYPHSGEGYAGMFSYWDSGSPSGREYIQAPLLSPLEAGVNYRVSFYVSLADTCAQATNNFGAHFSEEQIYNDEPTQFDCCDVDIGFDDFVISKLNWTKITGCFQASGNEQYITIGTFDNANEIELTWSGSGAMLWVYYYIDDIDVRGPVDFGDELVLCEGDSLILDATTPDAYYFWHDFSFGPTYTVTAPGTYWVEIKDVCGVYTDTVDVVYFSEEEINLGNDTILCENETLTLDATFPGANYSWHDGSEQSTFEVTEAGIYSLEASLEDCTIKDSIEVSFIPMPDVSLPSEIIVCEGTPVVLDATTQNASYLWQDGSTQPTYTPKATGEYSVEVSVLHCSTEAKVYVQFNDCDAGVLELPNIITPNNDGQNDVFAPYLREDILTMRTKIYDRWGTLVFETDNLDIEWDGLEVNDGIYYWVITYQNIFGFTKNSSGDVTVLTE